MLPPMEVVFLTQKERPVYDYVCKQECELHVRYEVPAKLTKEELRAMEKVCRTTFMTLGCRDVARIDLRMTRGRPHLRHRSEPAAGAHARLQRPVPHRERREDRVPDAHRRHPERRGEAVA